MTDYQYPTGTGATGATGPAGSNGTIASRGDVTITTASIANLVSEQGFVTIGRSFAIVKIVANVACRVRLYSTVAQANADLSRPATQTPVFGTAHGVIMDFVLNASVGLTFICSPEVYGANVESSPSSSISYTVENLSGATQSVVVTLTAKIEEA